MAYSFSKSLPAPNDANKDEDEISSWDSDNGLGPR
jgi:hypothetical protein